MWGSCKQLTPSWRRRLAKWLPAITLIGLTSTSTAETEKAPNTSTTQVTKSIEGAKAAARAIKDSATQANKSALDAKTKALKNEALKTTTEAAKATANRLKDGALSELKTATEQTQREFLSEQARLQREIASLKTDLKESQVKAHQSSKLFLVG